MPQEKYYRLELDHIRQQGKKMALQYPHLAPLLQNPGTDAVVEKIIQSFAALAGPIHHEIDSHFPGLTRNILSLLMPSYCFPIPSCTQIHFYPEPGSVTKPFVLPRGTPLYSHPVAKKQENIITGHLPASPQDEKETTHSGCCFTTSRDMRFCLFNIEHTELHNSLAQSTLVIHLTAPGPLPLHQAHLDELRFFVGHNPQVGEQLYQWLSLWLCGGELQVGEQLIPLPRIYFEPAGFAEDEALLPWTDKKGSGYRVLQEYFYARESFLYLDIRNFPELPTDLVSDRLILRLHCKRPFPAEMTLDAQSILVNCVPAVNRFHLDSESPKLDGKQTAFPLRVSRPNPGDYTICAVERVTSSTQKNRGKVAKVYRPFASFRHTIEASQSHQEIYYQLLPQAVMFNEEVNYSLAFVHSNGEQVAPLEPYCRVELACSNGALASQLNPGDICLTAGAVPRIIQCRNLNRPTAPLPPPSTAIHWSLLSSLAFHYMTLSNRDAFCQVLRVYDLHAQYDNQRQRELDQLIDSIIAIDAKSADRLLGTQMVRGLDTTMTIAQQGYFHSEGALYLFGLVLSHFCALYATVNSYHQLTIINADTQEHYRYPLQPGQYEAM